MPTKSTRLAEMSLAVRIGGRGRSVGSVVLGIVAMNLGTYGFTIIAAHRLGPVAFGELGSLLGILNVVAVAALALQLSTARRIAAVTAPTEATAAGRPLIRLGWPASAVAAIAVAALTPVWFFGLRLHDPLTLALLVLTTLPLTITGTYAGLAQGRRRWALLGSIYASNGVGRLVLGGIAIAVSPTTRGALVGVAVGTLAPAVVGRLGCGATARIARLGDRSRDALRELWGAGHALLAFFLLTNIDILLARHLLSHQDAGIYAAGLTVSKACLFISAFVPVIAFPAMARTRSRASFARPLLVVAAIGAVAVVAAWLLAGLVVVVVGGHQYDALRHLTWLFAVEGGTFACLQVVVYARLAARRPTAGVLWGAVVVVLAVALGAGLVQSIAALVVLLSSVAAVAAVVLAAAPDRRRPTSPRVGTKLST